jgi:hypothetical protein
MMPLMGVIRNTFRFISSLNSMILLNQINYVSYWERMLECPKHDFTEQ